MEPMACLSGHLKDLFIHNYFPMYEHMVKTRVNQEHVWERKIMGDHYDSLARGKQYTQPASDELLWS
ncbi:hypothetical protein BDW59DRAFT_140075 [Aspergillus cavernicola]|uniref:Berberine/berberine-like domain-containing protein n=1 Tax=Aspergillus cavernicola TaxID=176166 RepID=A0ABR4IW55_9EURO